MTKKYRFGLLGHPVKHSLSPLMHSASFRALGIEAEYLCFDVPPESLAERLAACRRESFDGLNLTVPLKEAALPLMDRLDPSARLFGAVNTVRFGPHGLTGFNTDAEGFLADLSLSRHMTPWGRRVLILGCGGAGRALAIACVKQGAAEVLLADQTTEKVERLAADIGRLLPDAEAQVEALTADAAVWKQKAPGADLVVQCTPVGLREGDAPVLPPEAFRPGQLLYDIIYTSRVTPTMRAAQASGADTMNGAGMLAYQGAAAFTLWTGMTADAAAMRAALEAHIYGS
ncbi:MAG: shikimate dehydrogenase [Kiritimatiellae bacterium]|nr:shikimate dehydrogenase [Kiritimatiellia bacterium]